MRHWHIDYLLDEEGAQLSGIWAIQARERKETIVACHLESDPFTEIVERGLGANDAPGHTHILRTNADETWWDNLAGTLQRICRL